MSHLGSMTAGLLPPSCRERGLLLDWSKEWNLLITSVVTGLNVLAAAVSTMVATREPPVYKTIQKISVDSSRRRLPTNYDPTEAPESTKRVISLIMHS